jgi:hypothetical protein
MGSGKRSPHRRSEAITVELLEGRALLSTVVEGSTSTPPAPSIQVQPMAVARLTPRIQGSQAHAGSASAADALSVGHQYSKVVFSSNTRRVGWHYLRAALHGDINSLSGLGNTRAVKKVGQSFTHLGNSTQIKALSHSFDRLGKSISGEFHKIFG